MRLNLRRLRTASILLIAIGRRQFQLSTKCRQLYIRIILFAGLHLIPIIAGIAAVRERPNNVRNREPPFIAVNGLSDRPPAEDRCFDACRHFLSRLNVFHHFVSPFVGGKSGGWQVHPAWLFISVFLEIVKDYGGHLWGSLCWLGLLG